MKEDKRNRGFPNLDKYLKDRGRKLVNYEEGAEIYGIPYYSFVRLEVTLINVMSREMILKNYVDEIRDWFDYILIDCMPSLPLLQNDHMHKESSAPPASALERLASSSSLDSSFILWHLRF